MALTTNYSWSKPTNLGSSGVWGSLLNTIFDAIDAKVKEIDITADAAHAGMRVQAPAIAWWADVDSSFFARGSGRVAWNNGATAVLTTNYDAFLPLELKAGANLVSFSMRSYIATGTNTTSAVDFGYHDQDGVWNTIATALSVPAGAAPATTTRVVGHVAVTGRSYGFRWRNTRTGAIHGNAFLYSIDPVVTAP